MDLTFEQLDRLMKVASDYCDPDEGRVAMMERYIEMLESELEGLRESNADLSEQVNQLENAMDEAAAKYDKYVPTEPNPMGIGGIKCKNCGLQYSACKCTLSPQMPICPHLNCNCSARHINPIAPW